MLSQFYTLTLILHLQFERNAFNAHWKQSEQREEKIAYEILLFSVVCALVNTGINLRAEKCMEFLDSARL
jgi:hypothetical protein